MTPSAAPQHVTAPSGGTFCGQPAGEALPLAALETAAPGAVCAACLGQVMEYEREGPYFYRSTLYTGGRVISETFSHIYGAWAHRLLTAQALQHLGQTVEGGEVERLTPRQARPH